jgi:hemoglobin
MSDENEVSLYRRLGGYDVIAAAIDGMYARQRADPRLARFAGGRSEDSRLRGRQLLVDQLCALSGGPCVYTGRDMRSSHKGLGITEDDWQANLKHMRDAMADLKIPEKEREEVIALWAAYKGEIVE